MSRYWFHIRIVFYLRKSFSNWDIDQTFQLKRFFIPLSYGGEDKGFFSIRESTKGYTQVRTIAKWVYRCALNRRGNMITRIFGASPVCML